jgi:hypothetical protein
MKQDDTVKLNEKYFKAARRVRQLIGKNVKLGCNKVSMNDVCKYCMRSQAYSSYDIYSDASVYRPDIFVRNRVLNPRLLVALKLMRVSEDVLQCNVCDHLSSICPYCGTTNLLDGQSVRCIDCGTLYYAYL